MNGMLTSLDAPEAAKVFSHLQVRAVDACFWVYYPGCRKFFCNRFLALEGVPLSLFA